MTFAQTEAADLALFRQRYYGLLVRILAREPTEETLALLREGIAERMEAARAVHPDLGAGWEHLRDVLPGMSAEAAAEEFVALFIGPFQVEVSPYESAYLTGQLFQAPLAALRGFLAQVGLERIEQDYAEPEDILTFELEVMNWLLTRQGAAQSAEEWAEWEHRQSAFLKRHLLIWGMHAAQDLEQAKSAVLYKGVALLLRGLLSIERQRLQGLGIGDIETLDEARRRYGAPRAFQGPMFDPAKTHVTGGPQILGNKKK